MKCACSDLKAPARPVLGPEALIVKAPLRNSNQYQKNKNKSSELKIVWTFTTFETCGISFSDEKSL